MFEALLLVYMQSEGAVTQRFTKNQFGKTHKNCTPRLFCTVRRGENFVGWKTLEGEISPPPFAALIATPRRLFKLKMPQKWPAYLLHYFSGFFVTEIVLRITRGLVSADTAFFNLIHWTHLQMCRIMCTLWMLLSNPDKTRALLVRNYLSSVPSTSVDTRTMGLDKSGWFSTVQVPFPIVHRYTK